MPSLSESQLLLVLLAGSVLLIASRGLGELARRIGFPEVLGALFAGFLLGPSVFGAWFPLAYTTLFLQHSVALVLSSFSWLGAILLLLLAGLEVDLTILRQEARSGILAAAFAIIPSLIAGSLFALHVFGTPLPGAYFLGVVLSVTAVSVVAKLLMERGTMRRSFAQLILAAGIASEVLVWLFVSVVSSLHSSSPVLAGVRSTLFAIGFFLFMVTVGRRFTFWAMRRVGDHTLIGRGQLTLVLALCLLSAAATQALGLHPLLGAFAVGVVLSVAPRTNQELFTTLEGITSGFFAPIFFALAGMRVDILRLGSLAVLGSLGLLFVVATVVKVGFSALGARLGGQRGWESLLVGVGLNLKGGTDVIVAVVGTEMGLLSIRAYTMYAVVAMVTVLISPPLLAWLERRTPPTAKEETRLEVEEAERRSYVPHIERVMVPVAQQLYPTLAASVVERIAAAKHEQGEIFDITTVNIGDAEDDPAAAPTRDRLEHVGSLGKVQLTQERLHVEGALPRILQASEGYDLIAMGARPPLGKTPLSLGDLQDQIIDQAKADVLVAIDERSSHFDCQNVNRILVPTNGHEYSMAAGDIAAALAEACGASLCILHVVRPNPGDEEETTLEEVVQPVVQELGFRVRRLGGDVDQHVVVAEDIGEAILRELGEGKFDLLVMGGVDRGADNRLYLGHTVHTVLSQTKTPAVLFVGHN